MILKYRNAAAAHVGKLKRYLMHGSRSLAAGLRQSETFEEELRHLQADAKLHNDSLMSGYLSFSSEGQVPPLIALDVVDQALAESLLRPAPAIIVVHGPPVEPTAVHTHFIVAYRGLDNPRMSRNVARRSLTAALADVGSQYGWTSTPGPPRRLGATSIAAEVFRDDLTLATWIKRNLDPERLKRCRSACELGEELARFGLSYTLSREHHGLLRDHSTGLMVRASILGVAYQPESILERFGSLPTGKPKLEDAVATYHEADRRTRFFTDHQRAAHRKAREEWERTVQPLQARRRSQIYASHAERVRATVSYFKELRDALPPLEGLSRTEYRYHSLLAFRKSVRTALRANLKVRLKEAERDLDLDLARVLGVELRKPSRFIRTWLREQQQPPENPLRIERTSGSASPEAPWRAVPALGGGTDLFVGRKRLATDDGKTVRILDATLEDELIARLPAGISCLVCGPDDFRLRALEAVRHRGVETVDGGADPPHYGDRNVAQTALALHALGIQMTVDGEPFTPQSDVFAASEVRVVDDTVVAIQREDIGRAVERLGEPDVVAGNLALYVTDSADEADELAADLEGLRIADALFESGTTIQQTSRRLEGRARSIVTVQPEAIERRRSRSR